MCNAACLYRVSTKTQLTDNDIPAQRNACRVFAEKQGWHIAAEYIEKGVSGYHTPQSKRGALTAMKKDAEAERFDILLVYMFDRLGRREEDCTALVAWLAERGITVWSVTEGPQKLDGHTDRLVSFIRFWQSAGESAATSMRVAEKQRQMVLDGIYRGGVPPFGYKTVPSDECGRRGRKRHKLAVNESEAKIVRLMYSLLNERNLGCYSVAMLLNKQGHVTRFGHRWTAPAVNRTVRNPIYKGDYVSGKVINAQGARIRNDKRDWTHARRLAAELVIVDESRWDTVNRGIDARRKEPRAAAGKMSLLGLVYCGYCGARLAAGGNNRRYDCPRRMRLDTCGGAFGYGAKKVECVVYEETGRMLGHLSLSNEINRRTARIAKILRKEIISLEEEIFLTLADRKNRSDSYRVTSGDCFNKESEMEQYNGKTDNQAAHLAERLSAVCYQLRQVEKTQVVKEAAVKITALCTYDYPMILSLAVDKILITRECLTIFFRLDTVK